MPAYGHEPSLQMLSCVPLCAGLSMGALVHMARIADEVDLPKGKVVVSEGSSGGQLFVLLTGGADVRRKGRKVATMRQGDFFGEISLLTSRPATATVTLAQDSSLLVITRAAFRRLLLDRPSIRLQLLDSLAQRFPTD